MSSERIDKCDMCGTKIVDGKCSCGEWTEDNYTDPMRIGIETFHKMNRFTLTGDAPHLGCAVIYFRGDYNDTKKVEQFIFHMKNRPYYNDFIGSHENHTNRLL